MERWPEREISLNFVLSLLETPVNKQTRLRQIKNLSLPQLIVAPRISRVICVIPSPLHQLYNLSKINNESKCFTVHFRLDLRSSQFRTSSYHKKYTPSTFFLERKNYFRTFTTINTFLLLFFEKIFSRTFPNKKKEHNFPFSFFSRHRQKSSKI